MHNRAQRASPRPRCFVHTLRLSDTEIVFIRAAVHHARCDGYRDHGGALHYLGGNGFYWRIARHREDPALLEIRRAEDGLRAWASQPGEYYNAFDGAYGGLWRRSGRAPQKLVGI